ncbi:serine/threonine-protein kinase HipA [Sphingomonas endophytica]|uniref:Serine/threonine-protein kinase HipA n=1 Tax=Sphingomonas endophytica TaxID=869719 RepID=A0A7X0MNJ4_9SPHN|nr:type II toxin-antitoxin system HipA family toxin [Sphingomonas endophytica]MBB6505727.1 serine/threonine-protein kinase HipA [Sphingomonas endophytica]
MARRSSALTVLLNGRHVGQLARAANGAIDFRYAHTWLDWEHAMPVSLSLPLDTMRYTGAPVTAVFDNLLPDSDDIRRRIAARVGAGGGDAYSLLAAVGRDCVGALQFLPDGEGVLPATLPATLDAEPIGDAAIATLLRNLGRAPLGLEADDAFRLSIAGAQEKTALLWSDGQWWKPRGATPTTHILKPQIGELPNGIDLSNSVENEHLCLGFLRELGLPVATTRIVRFDDRPVLVVERFDRFRARDGRLLRRPQEDLCQALGVPPTRKYEDHGGPGVSDIVRLLAASDRPDVDRRMVMKAVIAFWLLGATDGHAKNFSIHLGPGGRFTATPLYDVLSAEPSLAAHQIKRRQMRLAMAIGDRRRYRIDEIAPRHFLQTAVRAGYDEASTRAILAEIGETAAAAFDRAVQAMPAGTPAALVDPIGAAIRDRAARIDAL